MKATLLLADAAQDDPQGKIHALGLGWTITSTPTPPMAVIILVDVDWDETNRDIKLTVELLDSDGKPVSQQQGPFPEPTEVRLEAVAQAGRPPGMPAGSSIRLPLTVSIGGGLVLAPGQRYQWRATIDGFGGATATESFLVQAGPPGPHSA